MTTSQLETAHFDPRSVGELVWPTIQRYTAVNTRHDRNCDGPQDGRNSFQGFVNFFFIEILLKYTRNDVLLLNAAARVVSGTHKFDRGLTHLLHSELRRLDVPQRIQFKLGVTVHRCLRGNAPQYLVDSCKSTTDAVSRQRLRSASRHQLIRIPFMCCGDAACCQITLTTCYGRPM